MFVRSFLKTSLVSWPWFRWLAAVVFLMQSSPVNQTAWVTPGLHLPQIFFCVAEISVLVLWPFCSASHCSCLRLSSSFVYSNANQKRIINPHLRGHEMINEVGEKTKTFATRFCIHILTFCLIFAVLREKSDNVASLGLRQLFQ